MAYVTVCLKNSYNEQSTAIVMIHNTPTMCNFTEPVAKQDA